jgi:hypothetical protein
MFFFGKHTNCRFFLCFGGTMQTTYNHVSRTKVLYINVGKDRMDRECGVTETEKEIDDEGQLYYTVGTKKAMQVIKT